MENESARTCNLTEEVHVHGVHFNYLVVRYCYSSSD